MKNENSPPQGLLWGEREPAVERKAPTRAKSEDMKGLFGGPSVAALGSTAARLPAPSAAGAHAQCEDPIVQLFSENPQLPAPEVPVESESEAELSRRAAAEKHDLLRDHIGPVISEPPAPLAVVPLGVLSGVDEAKSLDTEPPAATPEAAADEASADEASADEVEPAASPELRAESKPRAPRAASKPTLTGIASLLDADAPTTAAARSGQIGERPALARPTSKHEAADAEPWVAPPESAAGSQAKIERQKGDHPPPPPAAAVAKTSTGKRGTKSKVLEPSVPPVARKRLPVRAMLGAVTVIAAVAIGIVVFGPSDQQSVAARTPIASAKATRDTPPRRTPDYALGKAPAAEPAHAPPSLPVATKPAAAVQPRAAVGVAPKASSATASSAAVAEQAARVAPSAGAAGSIVDDAASGDSDKLLRTARTRLASGDAAGAESLARVALLHDHADHHAMEVLAQALINQQRGAEAVGYTDQMVRKRPKRAPYRILQGDAKLAAGDQAGAQAAFQEALRLEPQNQDAKRRLGL